MDSTGFPRLGLAPRRKRGVGGGRLEAGWLVSRLSCVAACALAGALGPAARAGDGDAVAISAKASGDYIRQRLPDGTFKPETFAFAQGGVLDGTEGGTKDVLDFMEVAKVMAGPLGSQGYLSSKDLKATRLLIVVYWGTTRTPEHATDSASNQNLASANAAALAANHQQVVRFNPNDSMAPAQIAQGSTSGYAIRSPGQIDLDNALTGALAASAAEDDQRAQLDALNANMLGYDSVWSGTAHVRGTAFEFRQRDLTEEIEARRYFVVLMAYDFQLMSRHKKAKLLWETRFSVREKTNDLSGQLTAMAASASRYFGRESGKLVHAPLPEGHVDMGPIKTLTLDERP